MFDARTVHSDALANGLRVIVAEEADASVVAAELVVKAGVADERPAESGAAHLLEHALWAYGGPGDPRAALEEVGGVTNAGTRRDFTHYYATVPAGRGAAELAVRALARMVLRDHLEESVVVREKKVVRDEVAERSASLPLLLDDLAFRTVYGEDHPYGRPLEGEESSFEALDATALEVFHRTWYVPNNMAVVLVGRVTLAEATAAVQQAFGALPRAPVPSHALPVPPRPAPSREVRVGVDAKQAYLMAAFVGPAITEPADVCATDALTVLLSEATCGRLYRRLLGTPAVAHSMGVDFLTQKGRALLGIWIACEPSKVEAVRRALREELSRLAAEPVSPQELAAVKRLTVAAYAFSNETPSGRTSTLAFYEALGNYREAGQYPWRVRALRAADVTRVAAWYAGEPTWIVVAPQEKGT